MLLELYDKNHEKLGVMVTIKSPHIQRTLEYGDETMDFYCPANDQWDSALEPETYVRTERQEYVVKSVEKSTTSGWRKVSAALNIEELEGCPYEGFESVEQTAQAVADYALEGTGWTADAQGITKKRTIRIEDDTTAWDVVKQIVGTYRCELEIDAINKRLLFTTRRGRDRGAYFIERLNLKSLGVKISSYGFFTRLIPIGKDGLHLWINEKNYIENHQYTDKTITQIWRDERYTVTAALQEDAEAKLEEASRPAKAYTAGLVDLAAQSDKYSALEYDLGDEVLLISEKTGERTRQRIVKLDEYPDDEKANTAELSNVRQTFAQLQKKESEMATKDAVQITTKRFQKTLHDGYYTAEQVNETISAMDGKILLEVSKTYAKQDSLGGYTKTDEVRSRFAMDSTSVEITSGEIAFKANTISIESDNFKLTKNGYVSASGTFKSQQNRSDGQVLYAVLEGRGIFNYSRSSEEAEGAETVCAAINTVAGEKSGWIAAYENGKISASMVGGVGRGFRVFSGDGSKAVVYANRGSDGKGYIGVKGNTEINEIVIGHSTYGGNLSLYRADGTRSANISTGESGTSVTVSGQDGTGLVNLFGSGNGGQVTLYHTNGQRAAQIYEANGESYFEMTGNDGKGGIFAAYTGGQRKLFATKFNYQGWEVGWKSVNGVMCLALES